jgi:hypothetical protein
MRRPHLTSLEKARLATLLSIKCKYAYIASELNLSLRSVEAHARALREGRWPKIRPPKVRQHKPAVDRLYRSDFQPS